MCITRWELHIPDPEDPWYWADDVETDELSSVVGFDVTRGIRYHFSGDKGLPTSRKAFDQLVEQAHAVVRAFPQYASRLELHDTLIQCAGPSYLEDVIRYENLTPEGE